GAITSPQSSRPDKTHFTARSRTTTNNALAIDPKRRGLFHGSKRPIGDRLSPHAKIDGSPSAKAIEQLMHNGRMPDHSEPTAGNMCSVMHAHTYIQTEVLVSMFHQLCATILD